MQLIPALDIIDNCVVRLSQGDYDKKTVYSDNPVMTAQNFKEAGVSRLHLVDLDGARQGRPVHTPLFGEIKKKTGCIIEAGGGIRGAGDVELYFQNGLNPDEDFVMIGSLPFTDPAAFEEIRKNYLRNILHTVDVWDRNVKISGWKVDTNLHLRDHLERMQDLGITNLLVTQIKRDGMLTGPDLDLYREIAEGFPGVRTIVSGGLSRIEDVEDLKTISGISGFIVGRAFYENKITFENIRGFCSGKSNFP